jgi:hypothetical protein
MSPGKSATKHLEIHLGWSAKVNGRWTAKKVSDCAPMETKEDASNLWFNCAIDTNGDLTVGCYSVVAIPTQQATANGWPSTADRDAIGGYILSSCTNQAVSWTRPLPADPLRFPLGTKREQQDFLSVARSATPPKPGAVHRKQRRDQGTADPPGHEPDDSPNATAKPGGDDANPPPTGFYLPPWSWKSGLPVTVADDLVLQKTPSRYRLSYAHQTTQLEPTSALFYADAYRTFSVTPRAQIRFDFMPAVSIFGATATSGLSVSTSLCLRLRSPRRERRSARALQVARREPNSTQ